MSIHTDMRAVSEALARIRSPTATTVEIADHAGLTTVRTATALLSLERRGEIERHDTTWRVKP